MSLSKRIVSRSEAVSKNMISTQPHDILLSSSFIVQQYPLMKLRYCRKQAEIAGLAAQSQRITTGSALRLPSLPMITRITISPERGWYARMPLTV